MIVIDMASSVIIGKLSTILCLNMYTYELLCMSVPHTQALGGCREKWYLLFVHAHNCPPCSSNSASGSGMHTTHPRD